MRDGIAGSRAVVACVNSLYQSRTNCIFELEETRRRDPDKPVVALLTQSNPFDWANADLKRLCNFQGQMYVDIGKVAVEQWVADEAPAPEQLERLAAALQPLFRILEVDLRIHPSMVPAPIPPWSPRHSVPPSATGTSVMALNSP